MHVWKFDENRCDFVPVHGAALKADPDGTFFVSRDDQLYLHEGDQVRRISYAETLIPVAGQLFERDRFEFQSLSRPGRGVLLTSLETADLQAEMQRDGVRMRGWLHDRAANLALSRWVIDRVLPIADGAWEQIEGVWADAGKYLAVSLHLSPPYLLPTLQLDLGELDPHGSRIVGTLMAQWKGDRVIDPKVTLHGTNIELGPWWHEVGLWFALPQASADAALMDEQ